MHTQSFINIFRLIFEHYVLNYGICNILTHEHHHKIIIKALNIINNLINTYLNDLHVDRRTPNARAPCFKVLCKFFTKSIN